VGKENSGTATNTGHRTFGLACCLLDMRTEDDKILSPDGVANLLLEHWPAAVDDDATRKTTRGAAEHRTNARGCDLVPPREFKKADLSAYFGKLNAEQKPEGAHQKKRVVLVCGAKTKLEAIHWIWDGWIAQGKHRVIAGGKAAGKSTLCFAMAAAISAGGKWPDGTQAPLW